MLRVVWNVGFGFDIPAGESRARKNIWFFVVLGADDYERGVYRMYGISSAAVDASLEAREDVARLIQSVSDPQGDLGK